MEFQQYGKDQFDATLKAANEATSKFQAIATAFGDYSKKSFEESTALFEKLSAVKSLDKAIEVQTEYAKSSYETFVAESKKIGELYTDLAKDAYKPFESYIAKFTPAR